MLKTVGGVIRTIGVPNMRENRLNLLGISECRWTDFGKSVNSTSEVIHSILWKKGQPTS